MKIQTGRLYLNPTKAVPFEITNNQGGPLAASKVQYLIIHYTAGGNAAGAISWFKDKKSEASAHFVVDHDGSIVQMVRTDRIAWHAGKSSWLGKSGLNQYSIGIEIANWGLLTKSQTGYVSSKGHAIPPNRVVLAKHKNFQVGTTHGWEAFDEAQIESVLKISKVVTDHFGIPAKNVLGHDDIAPIRKQDPGPAFNLDGLRAKLTGRKDDPDDAMRVNAADGLNMRQGPGVEFPIQKKLPAGTIVRVVSSEGVWYEVVELNASGTIADDGWVHSRYLSDI